MQRRNVQLHFIGVGAAKSGTSWLSHCLGEHPEVCMAEPKELNYFCEKAIWPAFGTNSDLGPGWLAGRFTHCGSGQLLGEFSPNYLCDPISPKLIREHNRECRLIFCFRHPAEAIASYYYQLNKEAAFAGTFEDFLSENDEICEMGFYYRHVEHFLSCFPREQCVFFLFDDIQGNPRALLKECFAFLGISPDFVPPSLSLRINEAQRPRSRWLARAISGIRLLMRKHVHAPAQQRLLWKMQLYRLHGWITRHNLKSFTPPPIDKGTRERLLALYRDDVRLLGRFLQRDLSHWEH